MENIYVISDGESIYGPCSVLDVMNKFGKYLMHDLCIYHEKVLHEAYLGSFDIHHYNNKVYKVFPMKDMNNIEFN